MGREVVVHVELGTLGVDDLSRVLAVAMRLGRGARLYRGASSRHCDEMIVCVLRKWYREAEYERKDQVCIFSEMINDRQSGVKREELMTRGNLKLTKPLFTTELPTLSDHCNCQLTSIRP